MGYGFAGRIARVDLSTRKVTYEGLDEGFYRTYLGGKGVALHYLLREQKGRIDAFAPQNHLIFAASVVVGAPVPAFARFTVAAKSPLTGGYGESEAGGYWGPRLKFAGFDAVVIEGRSEQPVYLWLHDGIVEIRPAVHLWGLDTAETEGAIRSEINQPLASVASIGPAGEAGVRYSCIIADRLHAAGRCGMGAVMGSKRLKAVAVSGRQNVQLKDPEAVTRIAKWYASQVMVNPMSRLLYEMGTPAVLAPANAMGTLPTRNFREGAFEGWEKLSGEAFEKTIAERRGCFACPVRCKKIPHGSPDDEMYGLPEYETIAAFGSNLGVSDPSIAIEAHKICNRAGLDTISAGMSVAFAMECFERGILGQSDVEGLDLRFGNGQAALQLLRMIARREGIGKLLGEGTRRAAAEIGRGSEAFALHVKGVELPMHDPRGKVGVGLGYAVAEHGADHMTAAHDTLFAKEGMLAVQEVSPLGLLHAVDPLCLDAGKVRYYFYLETFWNALKALSGCLFGIAPRGLMPITMVVDVVRAVTGWDFSLWELMKAGERASCMARAFNYREGFRSTDDQLPQRLLEASSGEHTNPGISGAALDSAKKLYYGMSGWEPATGRPLRPKLEELGIGWVDGLLE